LFRIGDFLMPYIGAPAAPQFASLAPGSVETSDIQNGAVTQVKLDPSISLGVRVSSVAYPGDDTAADPAGGQTITITGAGFAATPTVYIDNTIAPSVSFVSSTQITFTTPAKTAGTYNLFVINPDGSTAIHVMGISYSGTPTWTTPAGSLGTQNAAAISVQLIATGDTPLVYSLTSGSTLPAGVTLSSSGLISGTLGTAQTFSFSVDVTDPQYQTTPRSFSLTVSVGEPYFQYVTLLLSGNQPSGVTDTDNKTFKDSSANNFTISRAGNTTQGTFTPFSKVNGRWGTSFSGSGQGFSRASADSNFSTIDGDWTWEGWVNVPALNDTKSTLISIGVGGSAISYTIDVGTALGKIGFNAGSGSWGWSGNYASNSNVIIAGQWNHFAIVRSGTTLYFFANGAAAGSVSSASFGAGIWGTLYVCSYFADHNGSGAYFAGTVSNLRFVKGTALYSGSTYTVPTSPLTAITNTKFLVFQSNRFVDNSSNAYTLSITGAPQVTTFSPFPTLLAYSAGTNGGSAYFDGSGDYLLAASNAAFAFGTGDFTFETFAYYNSLAQADAAAILNWDGVTWAANKWSLHLNHVSASNKVTFFVNNINSNAAILTSTTTMTVGQWYHIAVSRSGSTFRLFINGVLESTSTSSASLDGGNNSPIYVGGGTSAGNTQWFNGYLSSPRLVKGTAVYTAAFTPPTAPLTAITNTSLLLNYTNGAIIDSSMANDLETAGNAQISTTQSKWGGASMYFDGTGDYLLARRTPDWTLSGDFTIEFWLYYTAHGNYGGLVSCANSDTNNAPTAGWCVVFYSTTDKLYFEAQGGVGIQTTNTIPTSQWNHIAVVRSGSTITHYLNGTSNGSGTSSATYTPGTTDPLVIGSNRGFNSTVTGYIDDLRITKGYARYTANFTPPTGPFIGNGV
jgi:hypothetical protein